MSGEPASDDATVQGLTDRVRNLLLNLDRLDRLETAGEYAGWLSRQDGDRLEAAARDMLQRALRCVGDPVNYDILCRLDPLNVSGVAELSEASGLDRVALSERLNDLAQVGLVSREMVDDSIRSTPLAVGVCSWIDRVTRRTAASLARDLTDRTR